MVTQSEERQANREAKLLQKKTTVSVIPEQVSLVSTPDPAQANSSTIHTENNEYGLDHISPAIYPPSYGLESHSLYWGSLP